MVRHTLGERASLLGFAGSTPVLSAIFIKNYDILSKIINISSSRILGLVVFLRWY